LSARIPTRFSKWANRSHRIGVFAIPILVIGVVASRFDYFDELETFAILGAGFLCAFVAVAFAALAMIDIWNNGDRGFGRALAGLFFGLVGFAPAVALGAAVLIFPQVTDVSSDIIEPPIVSLVDPGDEERISRAVAGGAIIDDLYGLPLELPIDQVYALILQLIESRDWTIVRDERPGNGRSIAALEVETRTPVLRLRDRAVIRMTHFQQGTLIDMRSVTLRGRHDFGANLRRVNSLFDDIIEALNAAQAEPEAEAGEAETQG